MQNNADEDVVKEYAGIAKDDYVVVESANGMYTLTKAEKVEGKSVFESFNISYNIECKHIDEQTKVSHAVQLATDKYCGGLAMLRKIAPVAHSISIVSVEIEA